MTSHHRSWSSSSSSDHELPGPAKPFAPSRRGSISNLTRGFRNLDIENDPHTPQRPRSPTRHEVPPAPKLSRRVRLLRPNPNDRIPKLPADQILLEHLYPCRPLGKHYAKVNDRAKAEGYDRLPFLLEKWEREELPNRRTLDELFKTAIIHNTQLLQSRTIESWGKFREFGQLENDLIVEADVTKCVLSNVLNPLADIFSSFIHPAYQAVLHCVVRTQQNVRPKDPRSKSTSHFASPARLDHAVFLTERVPPRDRDYVLQIPLVIVEDKAPGIIRKEDWEPSPSSDPYDTDKNWMGRLVPQLFLYSDRMKCSRLFLTNYNKTYCVRIEEDSLQNAVAELDHALAVEQAQADKQAQLGKHSKSGKHAHVEVERREIKTRVGIQVRSATDESDHDSVDKDPFDFGFRPALAYEVFLALFELGVANYELVAKEMPFKNYRYPVDATVGSFLEHHRTWARRGSESPTRGPADFEIRNPQ